MIYYIRIWGAIMKKIELLSPAGNMKCLKAAIEAGCDAIYLSGKLFGARAFAGNFSDDELITAINYAHLYGVKIYVAINTIIYEREVNNFINYVRFLHKNNVDAVIIQDLGMFDLLRKKFPNLEMHASTQMHVHNFEGALLVEKLGAKRVVMARETPISVIRKIKEKLNIEVEVFVHGALCVSYSGQCLASALIGKRSGNRGTCAQICRKKYDLYDERGNKLNDDKYLLSTKDLCMLKNLDDVISSGVDSLKIEGRMKRPEYVYLVTKTYRKAINNYYETGKLGITNDDIKSLKKLFNRNFTKGFMLGEENNNFTYSLRPNHKGITIGSVLSKVKNELKIKLIDNLNVHDSLRIIDDKEDKGLVINKIFINGKPVTNAKPGDVITLRYDKYVNPGSKVLLTTDYEQVNDISDKLSIGDRKVPIDVYVEARHDKPLKIKVTDGINVILKKTNCLVQKAIKTSTDKDTIVKQISKTGNTIYKVTNIDVSLDNNVFINIKDINDIRRVALEELNKKRLYNISFEEKDYYANVPDFIVKKEKSILVNNTLEYQENKDIYDNIYVTDKSNANGNKSILKLPSVINSYEAYHDKVLIGELGSLTKYKRFDTDFSFNVVNSYAVAFLHEMGAEKVILSHELTLCQVKEIINAYHKRYEKHPNVEVIIKGYVEAMVCKFDLNKKYGIKIGYLKDGFKNNYKIVSNNDYMTIYNFEEKNIKNEEEYYNSGINSLRINL